MADQYDTVTTLLLERGLADWHVVEPLRGDVRDNVLIQNVDGRKVYVLASHEEIDSLSDHELLAQIRVPSQNKTVYS